MNNKRILAAATFAGFYLWASPAMAQTLGGDGGVELPPTEMAFVAPRQFGGCSRETPRKCTPEEREQHNDAARMFCTGVGGTVGVIDGVFVAAAVGLTAVGASIAPAAGSIHGLWVAGSVGYACYQKLRIPNA